MSNKLKDLAHKAKFRRQRATRGFDDSALWSVQDWFYEIMFKVLSEFKAQMSLMHTDWEGTSKYYKVDIPAELDWCIEFTRKHHSGEWHDESIKAWSADGNRKGKLTKAMEKKFDKDNARLIRSLTYFWD